MKPKHPFSDSFVLEIEAAVAGDTCGVQEGVAKVLEMIAERCRGWMVPLCDSEGVLALFLHRDDVGYPGDPNPTWADKVPDLDDCVYAVERLAGHFAPPEFGKCPEQVCGPVDTADDDDDADDDDGEGVPRP